MTATRQTVLAHQRQILRRRLLAQRGVIAHQLDAGGGGVERAAYPRSMTMRFLTRRPALAGRLLSEAAALLLGARLLKSVALALVVVGIVRSVAAVRPAAKPVAPAAATDAAPPRLIVSDPAGGQNPVPAVHD